MVYSCDCSIEALKRAEEMIYAADLVSVKDRFHPFLCDFSFSGFPKWLACDPCSEGFLQKQDIFLSGWLFYPPLCLFLNIVCHLWIVSRSGSIIFYFFFLLSNLEPYRSYNID